MKHIKSYKLFESSYTLDDFTNAVCDELKYYTITPVGIRTILDQYSGVIEDAVNNGEDPHSFVNSLSKDMGLTKGDFPIYSPQTTKPSILSFL